MYLFVCPFYWGGQLENTDALLKIHLQYSEGFLGHFFSVFPESQFDFLEQPINLFRSVLFVRTREEKVNFGVI